ANVIGAGLTEYARGVDRPGAAAAPFEVAEVVNRSVESSKAREVAGLGRGMPVLATVASSAPFVGLFGTVGGIITAFQKLADPTKGGGGIGTVSAGIAEALVTTAVGLGVAIIAVWFYNYFTARLDDITIDIDETASELVDTILRGHPAARPRTAVRADMPPDLAPPPRARCTRPRAGAWRRSAGPRGRCAPRS